MKTRDSFNFTAPRSRWRAGLTALAFAGLMGGAAAQTVDQYVFSSSSGANLDPMTGATVLIGTGQDDAASAVTDIGFSFSYEGVSYSQFSVNSNGGMKLGGTLIGGGAIYQMASTPLAILPFSGDGTTATGSVSTVLTGSSPNQVRVVQWNVGMDYNAASANCLYQLWLYESSGAIEFRYSNGAPTGGFWGDLYVAITGATAGNYLNVRSGPTAYTNNSTSWGAWPGNDLVLSFTPPVGYTCTTPAPGNTIASIPAGCAPLNVDLSLQQAVAGTGVSYQWQSSPDGNAPWTNVGTDNATYTATGVSATTWFRCEVTCANGPVTVASNPVQVTVSTPTLSYYMYNGTQFTETFDNWTDRCSTGDVPTGGYWVNTPAYGPGSWRISSVDGFGAGWGGTGGWFYDWDDAPAARFHNKNETPGGTIGTLDFYVNMSAGTGAEKVRFNYINGGDTFEVLVSTDGGLTFVSKGTFTAPYGSFQLAEYTIGSTSATTVVRIKSTAIGGNNNDSGVDNFRIIPAATCTTPTAPGATIVDAGEVDISWTCASCTGNFFVEYGAPGFTLGTGTVAGPFSSSPASMTGLSNGTYQAYVRQDCGGAGISENTAPVNFSIVAGDFCSNAINIATLGLTADDSNYLVAGNTTGAQNDYATSACGSQPAADVVLYHDVEPGAQVTFAAQSTGKLSVAIGGSCPGTTSLACTPGGYLPIGPYVVPVGQWGDPTFVWTNNGCQTERVYVLLDGGLVYMWNYSYTPSPGPFCATINGVSVNTVNSGTSATVNWSAACSGNVIVEYGPAGFTPGTGATAGQGTALAVNGTSTVLNGLGLDTPYDVYVRQDCGSGVYSANGTATPFTLHNGDDCSRVIALSGLTGSMAINTSGANNDASFCDPGDTGGDLILSYVVEPGYGIYFTSAPVAPYVGRAVVGEGASCPGTSLLYCNAGAADYYWVNQTASNTTVYYMQDGSDEGETTVTWNYFPECALSDTDGDGINDCDDSCINMPGENGDPCTSSGMPGIITNCQCLVTCNGNEVVVSITADNNASELSWVITDEASAPIASGQLQSADDNTTVNETICLGTSPANACYGFRLMDSFGDGITGGGWELRTTDGQVILRDAFDDGSQSPSATPQWAGYGSSHSFCLPLGPAHPKPTECGIFTNGPGNKVYCNKVTGATQYQFEFSDPDAGFIRRQARSVNYIHFWDLNPSLAPGVAYFARVRTDVDGPLASAHFGSGCEMGLAATVPCTQLISAPYYGHSCNETREFGRYGFIYAIPVPGADAYQFRIFNTSEGYDETFTRSTYILHLKWPASEAPGLVNGITYNVDVNVINGGVESGFCGTTCTVTILNPANFGGQLEQTGFGAATLWPNPVRGGQVNLSLSGLQGADQRITVDVQDIYGKQVFAQEFGNSGNRFSTLLQLPGDIATGVYLVNIIVDGEHTVQRLSIIR